MRAVHALLLPVLLSGCLRAIPLNKDPTVPFRTAHASHLDVYDVLWRTPLVKLGLLEYLPAEPASPAVDPDTERVYVATRDGFVRCLSPDTGEVEWEFKTNGRFLEGPTVAAGVLYVAGGDGVLYAFRALSGEKLWEYDAKEELVTSPTVYGDYVFVASQSETLFAVERATGTWKWQYRRDAPGGFSVRGAARPVVEDGVAYMGFADGYLMAIDIESGVPKWEKRVNVTGGNAFLDVDSTPVLQDGRIFAASYKDGVAAFSAKDGALIWQTPHPSLNALIARGKTLFGAGDGSLTAFDMETGRMLWSVDLSEPTSKGNKGHQAGRALTLSRGLIIVPTSVSLAFVDPLSGRVVTMWNPGRGVTGTPTAISSPRNGNRLYVLTNYGTVYALRMTGALR